MATSDFREPFQVAIHWRDLAGHVGEHLAATSTEAEPMLGTGWKINESSWRCRLRVGPDFEIDLALDDVERSVSGVTVWRWATALLTTLQKQLATLDHRARSENGDVLADDLQGLRVVLGRDDERAGSRLDHSPKRKDRAAEIPEDGCTRCETERTILSDTKGGQRVAPPPFRWRAHTRDETVFERTLAISVALGSTPAREQLVVESGSGESDLMAGTPDHRPRRPEALSEVIAYRFESVAVSI